ncbi:hypothetical protein PO124_12465 [Bacillus licheniformis]|nr:hypothetical protein [Bacillus licheniformis]
MKPAAANVPAKTKGSKGCPPAKQTLSPSANRLNQPTKCTVITVTNERRSI